MKPCPEPVEGPVEPLRSGQAGSRDRRTLRSVLWRSLCLQAVWNVRGLQHIGCAFALTPWLRRCYPDPAAFQRALQRHLGCFCSHPYVANILLGVMCALEEHPVRNGGTGAQETAIEQVKAAMAGPLAAIGDHVIWATWRPWAMLMGVAVGLIPWGPPNRRWPAAVVTFLGLYNIAHLLLRVGGLWQGFRRGTAVVIWLAGWRLQRVAAGLRQSGVLIGLGVTVMLLVKLGHVQGGGRNVVLGIAVFGVGFWMARRGWWGAPLLYLVLLGGLCGLTG